MAKLPITAKLDEDLAERLDHIAERTGETRSQVMERAIVLGLANIEQAVDTLESTLLGSLLGYVIRNRSTMQALAKFNGEEFNEDNFAAKAKRVASIQSKKIRKQSQLRGTPRTQ